MHTRLFFEVEERHDSFILFSSNEKWNLFAYIYIYMSDSGSSSLDETQIHYAHMSLLMYEIEDNHRCV